MLVEGGACWVQVCAAAADDVCGSGQDHALYCSAACAASKRSLVRMARRLFTSDVGSVLLEQVLAGARSVCGVVLCQTHEVKTREAPCLLFHDDSLLRLRR